jgi:acyl-CoA synthetase (AMP-forming)/AMP-acid ligase II
MNNLFEKNENEIQEILINSLEKENSFHEHFIKLAESNPDRILFTFLNNNNKEIENMTNKDLNFEAERIALYIKHVMKIEEKEKIGLLCNPGRDFIISFFGNLFF